MYGIVALMEKGEVFVFSVLHVLCFGGEVEGTDTCRRLLAGC